MSDLTCTNCGEYVGSPIADRIEELEVKLAKAMSALSGHSTARCFGSGEVLGLSLSDSPMGREVLARMDHARTTLAELKGEDRG